MTKTMVLSLMLSLAIVEFKIGIFTLVQQRKSLVISCNVPKVT